VLVEQAVHGAEIDLGVLEHPDGRIEIGPPLQIEHHSDRSFFDYEAKYRDSATRFVIPAPLSPEQRIELDTVAERAFRAIGCRDLARVDFLLPPDGGPVFNEINTFPGFSDGSQYPQIWAAAGRPLGTLLELLIDGVERRS
jgi:D-alanine-D-alanine ligase